MQAATHIHTHTHTRVDPSPLGERGHKALQLQTVRDPKYNNNNKTTRFMTSLRCRCCFESFRTEWWQANSGGGRSFWKGDVLLHEPGSCHGNLAPGNSITAK
ncbi:unnamed protein product [Polarella glacialis]|uniref:Uncharacterized protein n=1 Tax=Polarella glacialis TaxID=89957 RepID=A0A813GKP6_POLGL|nr:unnamed protein product [Polarella glacialis]